MRVSELVSDLQELRSSLADELLSINHYEPLIEELTSPKARTVVKRITDAHKEHAAMLSELIAELDPRQREANTQASGK